MYTIWFDNINRFIMIHAFKNKIFNNTKEKISADCAYCVYIFMIYVPVTFLSASICIDVLENKYKKNPVKFK